MPWRESGAHFRGPRRERQAGAHDAHAHEETDIWAIARGGQLCDNWMAVLEADAPEATHPAYPAAGKKIGAPTSRLRSPRW